METTALTYDVSALESASKTQSIFIIGKTLMILQVRVLHFKFLKFKFSKKSLTK